MLPMLYGIALTVTFWQGVSEVCGVVDGFLAELEARGEARASYDHRMQRLQT